jgi:hypothetical protein
MPRWPSREVCIIILVALVIYVWSTLPARPLHHTSGSLTTLIRPDDFDTAASFARYQRLSNTIPPPIIDKAFRASSIYGAEVLPYARRCRGTFEAEDVVTLITWITAERLPRLAALASVRRGMSSIHSSFVPSS